MSKAVFEKATGDVVGIMRVYSDSADVSAKPPYKFFTLVSASIGEIEIIGMRESGIRYTDALAIADEIITNPEFKHLDLKIAHWVHNGEREVFDLERRRKKIGYGT